MLNWWCALICSLIIVCESDIKKENNVIDLQFESQLYEPLFTYTSGHRFFFSF